MTIMARSQARAPRIGAEGSRKRSAAQYETAFVLSGGAARGALQVGMLQVLVSHGIIPDLIVGTSVGSWNGVWLAAHPTVEGMRALERIWNHVRFEDIFPGGPLGVAFHLVQHRPYLYGGDGIRRFLDRSGREGGFANRNFEDLRIPTAVVATNLTRGRPEVFDTGPLTPAVLASSAVPALLPSVTINGEQYVDGGLLDNCGLRVAIARGAKRIYVLDTTTDSVSGGPAKTFESVIERSFQVVTAYHLQSSLEQYARQADIVLLRDDLGVSATATDFRATSELIAAGRIIAERVLAAPAHESARSIQRRRAATWPVWTRIRQWEAWDNPTVRQVVQAAGFLAMPAPRQRQGGAIQAMSLPERVYAFAHALRLDGGERQPVDSRHDQSVLSGTESEAERAAS
ncbi:MAG TPA: patatin-like phospholipase family protein [Ktedonobacterales bacterium]|jgi:NTE family protein